MTHDITSSRRAAVDAFFATKRLQRQQQAGRLIFALDATASRQQNWDTTCELQAQMFAAVSGLSLQLVYYHGRRRECVPSPWFTDARMLGDEMRKVHCVSGYTQIERVFEHARTEHARQPVAALVFIGDCCEEDHGELYRLAAELKLPCFMFQEGDDPEATEVFAEIAKLTEGAHCRFDQGSARQLSELLHAVAVYAAGGPAALSDLGSASAVKLLQQLKLK